MDCCNIAVPGGGCTCILSCLYPECCEGGSCLLGCVALYIPLNEDTVQLGKLY